MRLPAAESAATFRKRRWNADGIASNGLLNKRQPALPTLCFERLEKCLQTIFSGCEIDNHGALKSFPEFSVLRRLEQGINRFRRPDFGIHAQKFVGNHRVHQGGNPATIQEFRHCNFGRWAKRSNRFHNLVFQISRFIQPRVEAHDPRLTRPTSFGTSAERRVPSRLCSSGAQVVTVQKTAAGKIARSPVFARAANLFSLFGWCHGGGHVVNVICGLRKPKSPVLESSVKTIAVPSAQGPGPEPDAVKVDAELVPPMKPAITPPPPKTLSVPSAPHSRSIQPSSPSGSEPRHRLPPIGWSMTE